MEKISEFFLSKVLNQNVYDEFEDNIGKLFDIYVTTEQGYPRVIGYKIKKGREIFNYEFRNIDICKEDKAITVQVRGVKDKRAGLICWTISIPLIISGRNIVLFG